MTVSHATEGRADGDGALLETDQLALPEDDLPLPWLQGDDDDDEFDKAGAGQTIGFVLLGILAIAVLVGAVWWMTSGSDKGELVADGSTIEAPDTPYKQKPENPGGKVFAGTGDTSFGISEGQRHPARLGEGDAKPGFTPVEKAPAVEGGGVATGGGKAPPAEAAVQGIGVQVAAYSNQQQAEEGWTRLSGQYSALAAVKHRVVQGQADIGTVYRLQAVAPDLAGAKALCQQLKAAGLNCQVKN